MLEDRTRVTRVEQSTPSFSRSIQGDCLLRVFCFQQKTFCDLLASTFWVEVAFPTRVALRMAKPDDSGQRAKKNGPPLHPHATVSPISCPPKMGFAAEQGKRVQCKLCSRHRLCGSRAVFISKPSGGKECCTTATVDLLDELISFFASNLPTLSTTGVCLFVFYFPLVPGPIDSGVKWRKRPPQLSEWRLQSASTMGHIHLSICLVAAFAVSFCIPPLMFPFPLCLS